MSEKEAAVTSEENELEKDPILGYGDWDVETPEEEDNADHINSSQEPKGWSVNEYDGFGAYDNE